MATRLPPAAALWNLLGRGKDGPIPPWLKHSARRKFSRGQRGRSILCRTTMGFSIQCQIGDPLDNTLYFEGEFEQELRLSLAPLAAEISTVMDVGCNIGYVSCLLAWMTQKRARIVSLDPNPEMIARCEENLRLNGFPVEAVCCAAGRVEETRTFHVPKNRPSFASFGAMTHDSRHIEVPVRRLDLLAQEKGLQQLDLLKIDVEGFEPEVLGGLGDLPVKHIYLEYSPGNLKQCGFSDEDLWALPLWKKYRLALIENGTARPIPFEPSAPLSGETQIVWAQAIA